MCCVTTSLERQHTSMFNLPGLTASFLWTSSTPYYCVDSFEQLDPAHGAVKQQAPASRGLGLLATINHPIWHSPVFNAPARPAGTICYQLSADLNNGHWSQIIDGISIINPHCQPENVISFIANSLENWSKISCLSCFCRVNASRPWWLVTANTMA